METTTTKGIRISVETIYKHEYSDPENNKHVFAYRITIENQNDFSVQLLRRHWKIFDSNGIKREVEGEGVLLSNVISHSIRFIWIDIYVSCINLF